MIMVEAEWFAFEILTLMTSQFGTSYLAAQVSMQRGFVIFLSFICTYHVLSFGSHIFTTTTSLGQPSSKA